MGIESFYEYPAGIALSRFLEELRLGRLVASKCSSCGHMTIPPRAYCVKCYRPIKEYQVIGGEGRIVTYTRSFINIEGKPANPPVTWVFVKFDGVDGGLLHLLDPSINPQTGMRVRPVFREQRIGSILDIKWFTAV
ncbi:MAG: Zn-ribbon domain-containing OB-fold protein [Nitrososphaerota archaeon]